MSDCGVCIGGGDFDGYIEMFDQRIIRSRKDHQCVECSRPITKGSECERTSGLWEGEFSTDYTCLDCMNIRQGLSCGEPASIGTLWDDVAQVFAELTTGCLQNIETASAKAFLMERWREWKGLSRVTNP